MICQNLQLSKQEILEISNQYSFVCGIDEVGWGALAGPVTYGVVVLPSFLSIDNPLGWKDSKKYYSEAKRARHAQTISAHARFLDVVHLYPETVLKCGPGPALYESVYECLFHVYKYYRNTVVFIDGQMKFPATPPLDTYFVPKADSLCTATSAASVVAKVQRDKLMWWHSQAEPQYGWDRNKGYPAKKHLDFIKANGISPQHRMNIETVRKAFSEKGYATKTPPTY